MSTVLNFKLDVTFQQFHLKYFHSFLLVFLFVTINKLLKNFLSHLTSLYGGYCL